MDEANIRKYARLMRELDLTALEITEGDSMVRLERGGGAPAVSPAVPAPAVPAAPAVESPRGTPVASPMMGVFYASPAAGAPPFVSVGDRVKKGDTLCIIEAMKLMNEIPAERDGIVTAVCVEDGQSVDRGTVLLRIE